MYNIQHAEKKQIIIRIYFKNNYHLGICHFKVFPMSMY